MTGGEGCFSALEGGSSELGPANQSSHHSHVSQEVRRPDLARRRETDRQAAALRFVRRYIASGEVEQVFLVRTARQLTNDACSLKPVARTGKRAFDAFRQIPSKPSTEGKGFVKRDPDDRMVGPASVPRRPESGPLESVGSDEVPPFTRPKTLVLACACFDEAGELAVRGRETGQPRSLLRDAERNERRGIVPTRNARVAMA